MRKQKMEQWIKQLKEFKITKGNIVNVHSAFSGTWCPIGIATDANIIPETIITRGENVGQ